MLVLVTVLVGSVGTLRAMAATGQALATACFGPRSFKGINGISIRAGRPRQ